MRLFSYTFKEKLFGLGVLIYIVIVCAVLVLIQITMHNWIISVLALIPAFLFLKLGIIIDKRLKLFEQGDDGEYFVKKELHKLPLTYHSHFDFQNGKKGNTDAIVVGPTGIWSIEVKSQKGEILFKDGHLLKNGYPFEKDFLAQSYAESKNLEEHIQKQCNLTLPVNPVLVFSDRRTKLYFGLNKQKGVFVIGINWLLKLMQDQALGTTLSEQQCIAIDSEIEKYTSII